MQANISPGQTLKAPEVLALSVFAAVLMVGAVALVDATESGLVISDVEAPVIGGVFATLAAASIGVVVGNRLLGVQKRRKDEEDESNGEASSDLDE